MSPDTWGKWLFHAREKHMVMLLDGRTAELRAVHRAPRSCKVKMYGRHYYCWVEDIALVSSMTAAEMMTSRLASERRGEQPESQWFLLDPWRIVPLEQEPRLVLVHSDRGIPSKSWLRVERNPAALHPSFQQAIPHPPQSDAEILRGRSN